MATPQYNRPYAQAVGTVPNGAPASAQAPAPAPAPAPGAAPLLPNQGRIIQQGPVRVLCIADVRGHLQSLNSFAREAKANYIIHTGDFGFYDDSSLDRIAEKTLRHVAQYSPLLSDNVKRQISATSGPPQQSIKEKFSRDQLPLSEFQLFLNKTYTLDVPVYTVWGACEDVLVLEKLRSGEYKIDNLHIIDEAHSRLLDVGGVKLRLFGLGGAVVMHKLFDNGEGRTTIAGGQGTMWTTLLQIGELFDTAHRVYDPTETRIFVTHASPAREGLLNQLSVALKADFSVSAGLHFRYGSSYNEFSVNPTLDHYRGKLAASKASFDDVWQTVKNEVEPAVSENEAQQRLLNHALDLVAKMPSVANGGNPFGGNGGAPGSGNIDESAFKNMWNFNLADAAYGWLVLDIEGGRIGTEMRAQGFNFAHRTGKGAPSVGASQPQAAQTAVPIRQPTGATPPVPASGARAPPPPASQPTSSHANKETNKPESKTNGASTETAKSTTPAPEKKPTATALFIRNAKDEDEVRGSIADEDKSKIDRIEKNNQFFIVHFKSQEDMQTAYDRVSKDYKQRPVPGEHKLNVSIYRTDRTSFHHPRGGHSGYRSGGGGGGGGGTASDSDPGRGAFRGGRGARGARGSERGTRGGRGRGNTREGSTPSSPAPGNTGGDS